MAYVGNNEVVVVQDSGGVGYDCDGSRIKVSPTVATILQTMCPRCARKAGLCSGITSDSRPGSDGMVSITMRTNIFSLVTYGDCSNVLNITEK